MIRPRALRVATIATIAATSLSFASCAREQATPYDLVVANGRVIDPESNLDAVRHVGIRGGTIATISETPLTGVRVIDASRHVVAPGFIDLHEHGQQEEAYRMMVRDGVTSALELEVGTGDVGAWYAAREGGQVGQADVAALAGLRLAEFGDGVALAHFSTSSIGSCGPRRGARAPAAADLPQAQLSALSLILATIRGRLRAWLARALGA